MARPPGGGWAHGDNIGDADCKADGTGLLHMMKPLDYWTIGGPDVSNVMNHALIAHTGADRIACGVIK